MNNTLPDVTYFHEVREEREKIIKLIQMTLKIAKEIEGLINEIRGCQFEIEEKRIQSKIDSKINLISILYLEIGFDIVDIDEIIDKFKHDHGIDWEDTGGFYI